MVICYVNTVNHIISVEHRKHLRVLQRETKRCPHREEKQYSTKRAKDENN